MKKMNSLIQYKVLKCKMLQNFHNLKNYMLSLDTTPREHSNTEIVEAYKWFTPPDTQEGRFGASGWRSIQPEKEKEGGGTSPAAPWNTLFGGGICSLFGKIFAVFWCVGQLVGYSVKSLLCEGTLPIAPWHTCWYIVVGTYFKDDVHNFWLLRKIFAFLMCGGTSLIASLHILVGTFLLVHTCWYILQKWCA